jgi:alkanesulfonate monooxygenase SsuD/methylene tetrahydromethanopterin reductase-like flavin-dependent oxidoreductase (luciferase family)
MDLGLHLPLIQFGDDALTRGRLNDAVDAAREAGFAAVSANDHLLFRAPWLDGPTALASVVERSGDMTLATTIALAVVRGAVPLAKALVALDVLSEGRLIAAVGPGSSKDDYDAVGVPFDERWKRFDEVLVALRGFLDGSTPSTPELAPRPWKGRRIPLWVGSWGSEAGLRRVLRLADGWLASAYNTTPDRFAEARTKLPDGFPNALSTMWTWVTEDRADRDRVLDGTLAPLLRRDRDELAQQLCIGSAEHCAEILSRYKQAGCRRVFFWPLGDEPRQIELLAREVAPRIA